MKSQNERWYDLSPLERCAFIEISNYPSMPREELAKRLQCSTLEVREVIDRLVATGFAKRGAPEGQA